MTVGSTYCDRCGEKHKSPQQPCPACRRALTVSGQVLVDEERKPSTKRTNGARKRERNRNYQRSVGLHFGQLGYSNALSAGLAVRQKLIERAEFRAQHGDCKILVRNGEVLAEPLILKPKL